MASPVILVVDDSEVYLKLASSSLLGKGYRVITATNGEEALQKVQTEKPDLVLLDVILPGKNGFQVCRAIKSNEQTRNIKVIMFTTKSQDFDKFWAEKNGADRYLTKPEPFVDKDLISCVEMLLRN